MKLNKDKQIEEMARLTKLRCRIDNMCGSCGWETCNDCLSEALYNAGYRKSQDVAKEIFAEIEILFVNTNIESFQNYHDEWVYRFEPDMIAEYAELKKKYTK